MMSRIREIFVETVTDTVRELFIAANRELSRDVLEALARAAEEEVSPLGRYALEKILENTEVARDDNMPLCQDTGLAVVFVEMGQDVHIVGGDFNEAVQEGVRQAYRDGYLRKSLCDPLSRRNTGDNTPAVIFTELVPGDQLKLSAMPKGGGSENMSGSVMLTPAVGEAGIRAHVVDCVRRAGFQSLSAGRCRGGHRRLSGDVRRSGEKGPAPAAGNGQCPGRTSGCHGAGTTDGNQPAGESGRRGMGGV